MAESLYPELGDLTLPTPSQGAAEAQQASRNYEAMMAARQPTAAMVAPPKPDNDVLTDISHGIARGVMVEAPEMAGRILQTFGANQTGKSIAEGAKQRGAMDAYRVTGLAGEVAAMVPTVAGLAGLALVPGIGPVGAARIAGGAFGASQYTATREKGGGVLPALGAAATQAIGQTIGVGAVGRMVSGAAASVQKGALEKGFQAFADPSLWGTMGRGILHAEATQLPAQAATAYGTAAFESGLPNTPTPWEAAKQSFAPTALLTAVLGPFSAPAIMKTNATRAAQTAALQNPNFSYQRRSMAANKIAAELRTIDPERTDAWRQEALAALNDGVTPDLHPDYVYDPAQKRTMKYPPTPPAPPAPPSAVQQSVAAATGTDRAVDKDTGVTANQPVYRNKFEAQLAWNAAFRDLEARARTEMTEGMGQSAAHKAMTDHLVSNPPEDVLSFADWVQEQKGMKNGPLAVGGSMTRNEAGLKSAYLRYVNEQLEQSQDYQHYQEQQRGGSPGQQELFPRGALEPAIPRQEGEVGADKPPLSFSDWMHGQFTSGRVQQGVSMSDLRAGYTDYVDSHRRTQGQQPFALEPGVAPREADAAHEQYLQQAESLAFPERAPEGQGELDLQPVMNRRPGEPRTDPIREAAAQREEEARAAQQYAEEAARLKAERLAAAAGEPAPTAMELAMREAGVNAADMKPQETQAQRDQQAADAAARDAAPVDRTPKPAVGVNPTARVRGLEEATRVAAANRQADDAVAGRINGNTPLATQDFARLMHEESAAAGLDLTGRAGTPARRALDVVKGKKLYVQQINELRKARDAMNPNTKSFEALSRLIARLENFERTAKEPTDGVPAEVAPEVNQGAKPESAPVTTGGEVPGPTEQKAGAGGNAEPSVGVRKNAGQGKAAEEVTPAPTEAAPAEAAPAAPVTPKEAAKQEVMDALGDLANLMADVTGVKKNLTPEQHQRLMPILIRLMDGAIKLGYHKIGEAILYVREQVGKKLSKDIAASIPPRMLLDAHATAMSAGRPVTPEGAKRAYDVARAQQEMVRETAGPTRTPEEQAAHEADIATAQAREEQARAAFQEATPELQEVRAQLAEIEAHATQLQELRDQYKVLEKRKKLSLEQQGERFELQKRIGEMAREQHNLKQSGELAELQAREAELVDIAQTTPHLKELSDAIGATERAQQRGRGEEAADPLYYSFTREWLDPEMGVARGKNLSNIFRYVEAHKYAGTLRELRKAIPDDVREVKGEKVDPNGLRKIFDEITQGDAGEHFSAAAGLGSHSVETRRAAQDALNQLKPADHKQFADYITQLVKAVQTAARVNEPYADAAKKHADAMRKWTDMHMEFDYQNAKVTQALKAGELTADAAEMMRRTIERKRGEATEGLKRREGADTSMDALATDLYNYIEYSYKRDIAVADAEKTGLAAISNSKMEARVAETPHAAGVLEHIGKTHHDPLVRMVAKVLAAGNPTARIVVVENPDFNGGRYVPKSDTIEIGRGGMNTTTMLHEITHALTHAGIIRALSNVGRTDLSPQHAREVEAIKTVQGVMEKFREIADADNDAHKLALSSEHEFMSEAMNNPEMQRMLGGKGNWWQQILNAIREFVPGWKKVPYTEFQKLMEAAPTLFGNPNRNLDMVFRRPLNYTVRDPFTAGVDLVRKLSNFEWVTKKVEAGTGLNIPKEYMKSWSFQQQKRMLHSVLDRAAREFPQHAGTIEKVKVIYDKFRNHLSDRSGIHQLVMTETNDIAVRALRLRNRDRALFDRMGEMGTEATRLRIDASAKTFAEAQARNPTLTIEEWNSPDAQKLRNTYRELEFASSRMPKRPGGLDIPTPIEIYHEMVNHHDLLFTRGAAENVMTMLRTYGVQAMPEMKDVIPQLDVRTQAGNGAGDVPAARQQVALDRGMQEAQRVVRAIRNREVATNGPDSPGAKDADSLLRIMEESYAHYKDQRTVPYMHIGRAGEHMVMFTVKGGDAEWNRIAAIVGAPLKDGAGLERGMGPSKDGNRRVYMKFDNISHYKQAEELLKKHAAPGGILENWADGPIDEKLRSQDSATPAFVRALRDRILSNDRFDPDTQKEMVSQLFDTYLQQLPDNSPLKASATRDGVNGYSTDYIQSFSDRAKMSAQGLSRMRSASRVGETMVELGAAMKGLREARDLPADLKVTVGNFIGDFRGRVDELNRPVASPFIDKLRAMPAIWRLAMVPAYVATIMYQPWQVTMPILGGKFGYANSLGVMGKNFGLSLGILRQAMKMGWAKSEGTDTWTQLSSLSNLKLEFAKLKNPDGSPLLSAEQSEVLHHVAWQNALNFGQTNQVARIDPESQHAGSKFMSIATIMPHVAEVSNRIVTALSAYELAMGEARKKGLSGDALEQAKAKAMDFAVQSIRESDGDHSQANIARNLGRHGIAGKATPLLVGFQHFFIQQTELMLHNMVTLRTGTKAEKAEAAKMLAGVTGMTGLMAGTLGMPFMGMFSALANMILSWTQDPNAQPPDVQKAVRDTIGKMVGGGKIEEVLARGLPRLAEIDMSSRAGLHDMAPFTGFLQDRRKLEDSIKDNGFDFLGPAAGVFAGIATGVNAAAQGDWPRFINDALPAGMRGYAKAYRMGSHGYETQGANTLIPIAAPSAWNLIAQSQGFTSAPRAEQSERAFQYSTQQQLLERRQQEIRNRIYRAYDAQDWKEVGRLMQEDVQFVTQHPQFSANISGGISQRMQSQEVGRITNTGILAGKKAIPTIMQQFPQMQQLPQMPQYQPVQ